MKTDGLIKIVILVCREACCPNAVWSGGQKKLYNVVFVS